MTAQAPTAEEIERIIIDAQNAVISSSAAASAIIDLFASVVADGRELAAFQEIDRRKVDRIPLLPTEQMVIEDLQSRRSRGF